MGLFDRRKRSVQAAPPDAALEVLDQEQAARLRVLVREAFARRGVEVTVLPDHARDDAGREFGLWNLAALCAGARRERDWPAIVDDHVDRVLRVMDAPDPVETMSQEQALAAVFLRLYGADGVPDGMRGAYAEELAPELLALLTVDLPESVAVLRDEDVDRLGGRERLREAGLRNLAAVQDLEHEVLERADGARLDVVTGDSFFTASLAILLPELVRRTTGETDLDDGVLVCVPFRHQVAFSVVRDASVIPTLSAMASFALGSYQEAPGPVSPWVYWWRGGTWTQLSGSDDDGALAIRVPPELQDVLERLVGE